jgi:hypothetical protein
MINLSVSRKINEEVEETSSVLLLGGTAGFDLSASVLRTLQDIAPFLNVKISRHSSYWVYPPNQGFEGPEEPMPSAVVNVDLAVPGTWGSVLASINTLFLIPPIANAPGASISVVDFVRDILREAVNQQVRFVVVLGLGVSMMDPEWTRIEQFVKDCTIPYCILRTDMLMESLAFLMNSVKRTTPSPAPPKEGEEKEKEEKKEKKTALLPSMFAGASIPLVASSDVMNVVCTVLADPASHENKIYNLAGESVSLQYVADALKDFLGVDVKVNEISKVEFLKLIAVPKEYKMQRGNNPITDLCIRVISAQLSRFDDGKEHAIPRSEHISDITGSSPMTVLAYLNSILWMCTSRQLEVSTRGQNRQSEDRTTAGYVMRDSFIFKPDDVRQVPVEPDFNFVIFLYFFIYLVVYLGYGDFAIISGFQCVVAQSGILLQRHPCGNFGISCNASSRAHWVDRVCSKCSDFVGYQRRDF